MPQFMFVKPEQVDVEVSQPNAEKVISGLCLMMNGNIAPS